MKSILCFLSFLTFLLSCDEKESLALTDRLEEYLEAKSKKDNSHWSFEADTIHTWFDTKSGPGMIRLRGKSSTGPWAEWDIEMNSYSTYDSLKADLSTNTVSGVFREHNDFFDLIGKKKGTKSRRVYYFNDEGLVEGVLMVWVRELPTTDQYLKPIVEWAKKNDSLEIQYLYQNNEITPSMDNAKRWKELLQRFNREKEIIN